MRAWLQIRVEGGKLDMYTCIIIHLIKLEALGTFCPGIFLPVCLSAGLQNKLPPVALAPVFKNPIGMEILAILVLLNRIMEILSD